MQTCVTSGCHIRREYVGIGTLPVPTRNYRLSATMKLVHIGIACENAQGGCILTKQLS